MKASPVTRSESEGGFYRISNTQKVNELQPNDILASILKNQYLYLDFGDDKNMKIIEKSDPYDSDEELQTVGNRYIAGLNNLSSQTYKMLHYLHEGRTLKEQKKGIDKAVLFKIEDLKNKIRQKQLLNVKGRRSRLTQANINFNETDLKQKKELQFPENPNELSEYLQSEHSKIVFQSLMKGEERLQKSISSSGHYKKIARNHSTSFDNKKSKDAEIKLPDIPEVKKKIKYIKY